MYQGNRRKVEIGQSTLMPSTGLLQDRHVQQSKANHPRTYYWLTALSGSSQDASDVGFHCEKRLITRNASKSEPETGQDAKGPENWDGGEPKTKVIGERQT